MTIGLLAAYWGYLRVTPLTNIEYLSQNQENILKIETVSRQANCRIVLLGSSLMSRISEKSLGASENFSVCHLAFGGASSRTGVAVAGPILMASNTGVSAALSAASGASANAKTKILIEANLWMAENKTLTDEVNSRLKKEFKFYFPWARESAQPVNHLVSWLKRNQTTADKKLSPEQYEFWRDAHVVEYSAWTEPTHARVKKLVEETADLIQKYQWVEKGYEIYLVRLPLDGKLNHLPLAENTWKTTTDVFEQRKIPFKPIQSINGVFTFSDGLHLDADGAQKFSEFLMSQIPLNSLQ